MTPECATCGIPATCLGIYEDPNDAPEYACDVCCGHGCEDGWCEPVVQRECASGGCTERVSSRRFAFCDWCSERLAATGVRA